MARLVALFVLLLSSVLLSEQPAVAAKGRTWTPVPDTGGLWCVDLHTAKREGKTVFFDEHMCDFDDPPERVKVNCSQKFGSRAASSVYEKGHWRPRNDDVRSYGGAIDQYMCSERA